MGSTNGAASRHEPQDSTRWILVLGKGVEVGYSGRRSDEVDRISRRSGEVLFFLRIGMNMLRTE